MLESKIIANKIIETKSFDKPPLPLGFYRKFAAEQFDYRNTTHMTPLSPFASYYFKKRFNSILILYTEFSQYYIVCLFVSYQLTNAS